MVPAAVHRAVIPRSSRKAADVVLLAAVHVLSLAILCLRHKAFNHVRVAPRLLNQRSQQLGVAWESAGVELLLEP